MPNIQSAKKKDRQDKARTIRRAKIELAYKKALKEVKKTTDAKGIEEKARIAVQKIDIAGKKRVISAKKANRHKSQVDKKVNELKA